MHLVMAAVRGLMGHVRKVDAEAGPHGWVIFIWTKVDDAADNLALLGIARDVVLRCAADSEGVHVLGYPDSQPAIPQPHGFMLTLCAPREDPRACCWDTYRKGFCPNKPTCTAAHPKCLVPLHVVVHQESSKGSAADRELVKHQLLGAKIRTSGEHMDMVGKIYAAKARADA